MVNISESPPLGTVHDESSTQLRTQDIESYVISCLRGWSNWQIIITTLLILVSYDQLMYIKRKGPIAGPSFKIPFMGPFIQALHPNFKEYLAQWASGPLSCVSVFHKFVVLTSDRDLAHKVFKSPGYTKPCLVSLATDIMGSSAWVFLQGKAHTEYRRGLSGLFTDKALGTYLQVQEKVYSDYFGRFVNATKANDGKPTKFMGWFREINCALSCRTFFGDYISQDAVKRIADDCIFEVEISFYDLLRLELYLITAALELVNVPLSMYIPYTKPWLGKRTADAVKIEFAKCAAACKANMASGAPPTCIVDQWVLHMIESQKYNDQIAAGATDIPKPTNLIRTFTNDEIASTLFTFLFASQDASSSATTWLFQVLAQRPDVLSRLRAENLAARNGDRTRPFEISMSPSLPYTHAVIKEILRHRPPVIFVPYVATKPFPVTPDYTVPKGAMIIPSCWPALHDPVAYPNPESFDPDRWITGDAESHTKNWLVFGTGAHDCLARKYVPLTMAHMIGKASLEVDWVHHATELSEEIRVFATLFPMDECPLTFKVRE
ncbi:cytochrome P450 [Dendryphion nanum]|uniref:sterol 22-desaturase n=1 Tax=Dendryphion nanum TaxID=256645 RepID=A0A9P9DPY6_9PLEO|nr:cytochrome P450 [Dendryphion nanum]